MKNTFFLFCDFFVQRSLLLLMDISIFRKYSTGFRQFIKVPTIELCSLLEDVTKNKSPIITSILKVLSNVASEVIKPCPYVGRSTLLNINADSKMLDWVPKGVVRFSLRTSTDSKKYIFKLDVLIVFEK
ncbi:hypothetical protein ACKWTF_015491 [Chironomus riparius]